MRIHVPTARNQGGGMRTDGILHRIAAAQHSVFTTLQAKGAGVGSDKLERRARAGLLTRVHQGVYRVEPIASPRWREMAAVLACGGRARGATPHSDPIGGASGMRDGISSESEVRSGTRAGPATSTSRTASRRRGAPKSLLVAICRGSAAAMHQLRDQVDNAEVTVAVHPGRSVRRHGIRVHRYTDLQRADITWIDNIPVTTPARTIIDLAPQLGVGALERIIGDAVARRLVTLKGLDASLRRHADRRGLARVAELLMAASNARFTRSQLEADAVAVIAEAGLPEPRLNERVAGIEVDLHWPTQRLVAELDGAAFHASFAAQSTDRRRDAVLVAAGYRVMRFTWRDVHEAPHVMLVRIAQALVR